MAASNWVTHTFGGGWATDYGPTFYGAPDKTGKLVLPFLQKAQNCFYELDGGPHKFPGTSAYNASATGASDNITGLFDYWRMGTTAVSTQKLMAYSNGVLYAGTVSAGTFTSIKTGMSATGVPCFTTFDDILIFSTDSTADVPQSYDQTTEQNLAGSPPPFSFSCVYKNKVFAAGRASLPSRLYYCVDNNPEDWTGAGSGSIDIDPDDGDRIVGLVLHKDNLWVFKGPYKGSIHRITGSAPTGADAYARIPFIAGLTTAYHNTIFRFGDDIGFMSPVGTAHSLNATAQYGDFSQAFLSQPIDTYVRTELNLSRLKYAWALNDQANGRVLFTVPAAGSTNNDVVLCMDYRFGITPPRWSKLTAFSLGSLAIARDTNNVSWPFGGGYVGVAYKMNQTGRRHVGASISMDVQTPSLTYGAEVILKTIEGAAIGVKPQNDNDVTFNWQADNETQQTITISQSGGTDVLLDDFQLDDVAGGTSDTLSAGGGNFVTRFTTLGETGGEGRAFSYEVIDNILDSDLELHNIGVMLTPGGVSLENLS